MRRCAIYTRKSTDEGLDQDFNSLDAQHEACEAFIRSQKHEGWRAVRARFDDGGYSGGSMDRPALARLLEAIERREIDVVVVYKVDRLTRSLADFAKIVELFDGRGISFVSVTQQFNTTSSMGRLTLNVLLSFAQFEREVTAERIRDKIAASKKKGMWMGGLPPLGYDVYERKLVVNEEEAETVRTIFRLYLEQGTVRALCDETVLRGIDTKRRRRSNGSETGGKPFSRGNLYELLANPIYIGKVQHKDKTYDGQHRPIIDPLLWETVQAGLAGNAAPRRYDTNANRSSMLAGLVYDETGDRLCPTHANKNGNRYRYYISKRLMHEADRNADGWRLRADELESSVVATFLDKLRDRQWQAKADSMERQSVASITRVQARLEKLIAVLCDAQNLDRVTTLRSLIKRIDLSPERIKLTVDRNALLGSDSSAADGGAAELSERLTLEAPLEIRRRGVEAKIVILHASGVRREPDPGLCKLVAQARCWLDEMANGVVSSVNDIAARDRIAASELSRTLPLAFLAPDIVEAILDGRQPVDMTVKSLRRLKDLPADWRAQRRRLGISH